MARISDSSFHTFQTGELVDANASPTGANLNVLFKLFQAAINDNYTRVTGLDSTVQGILTTGVGGGSGGGTTTVVSGMGINVKSIGAKGDGTTDDTVAIQLAINTIVSAQKPDVIYFPPGVYKISGTLTIDVSYVSITAYGATIDASAITSGSAIHMTGSVNQPYLQSTTVFEGFKLTGNGKTGTVIGIQCHTAGGGGEGTSHFTMRGLNISHFGIGMDYKDHSYAINHYGIDVYYCGICINQGYPINDGAEKMNFQGCMFYNSDLAVKILGSETSFTFHSCSFDYNTQQFYISAARIFLTNCHVEAADYTGAGTATAFYLESDAFFNFEGGWILVTFGLPHSMAYLVNVKDDNTTCRIANTFVNNVRTTSNYWATGNGQFIIENLHSFFIGQNPLLAKASNNLLVDGGFEQSTIQDNIFLFEDTGEIIHPLIGQNLALSLSTAQFHSGTKSLKADKVFGPFSGAAFRIVVPIPRKEAVMNARLWYNKPGTGTGQFSISTGWCTIANDKNQVPRMVRQQVRGELPITTTSAATGWVSYTDGDPYQKCPMWATHYYVQVYMTVWDSNGGSAIYFDDIDVQVTG